MCFDLLGLFGSDGIDDEVIVVTVIVVNSLFSFMLVADKLHCSISIGIDLPITLMLITVSFGAVKYHTTD